MPRKKKEPLKSKNIFLELKDRTTGSMKDKKTKSFTFLYFILAFVAMVAINSYLFKTEVKNIPYSEFKELIAKGKISDIVIDTDTVQGTLTLDEGKKTKFLTSRVEDPDLVKDLHFPHMEFAYAENGGCPIERSQLRQKPWQDLR
ncbi:MAG: ATP-dependent metallopeptidase FtsH/Yme1/Tma family protein [Deltaproteobacteria bacterium]|nr:ATP-dependent metallopeptidase FtsH/Yme1/Tma family protein [Deltaproteobacteria bacterium]